MQRGEALLPDGLHRHKAHRGPARGLANCLRIDPVGLAALRVRLRIGRRNEPHRVAKLCDLARPVMGRAAGLHRHDAGRKPGEEIQNLPPLELLAKQTQRPAASAAVNLKNLLGRDPNRLC